ncbi:hypothetical protein BOX15_Mlig020471g4, partial [Macrostomum lignano]
QPTIDWLGYATDLLIDRLAALASDWLAAAPADALQHNRHQMWLACCHWTNTRVVHCPGLNRPALVPYFDLFNHSPAVSAVTSFNTETRSLVLTTKTAYQAGDQVYINYGNHSNLTLLLEYDFVLESTNPTEHDCVPVSLSNVADVLSAKQQHIVDFLNQLAHIGMCPPADALLSDRLLLLKYIHLSVDGPSYYLLLLLVFLSESTDKRLIDIVHSMSEDQLTNCVRRQLRLMYKALKIELLRDRNWLVKLAMESHHEICRLISNCVQLIDIWCNIVNCLIDSQ